MKPKLILCLALVLSGGLAVVRAGETITNAASNRIVGTTNITVKLVVPGSTGIFGFGSATCRVENVTAKLFSHTAKTGLLKGSVYSFAAIPDPYTKKICIVPSYNPGPETNYFYISDKSGMTWCELLEGGDFAWAKSSFQMPQSAGGADVAFARFESEYDDRNLDVEEDNSVSMIDLRTGVPSLFFSSRYAPSQPAAATITGINLVDEILHLDLLSDGGKFKASLWIDLKAKRVIKSVVDGQEMTITGDTFEVPLKKK